MTGSIPHFNGYSASQANNTFDVFIKSLLVF